MYSAKIRLLSRGGGTGLVFRTFESKLVNWSSGKLNQDKLEKRKRANTVKRINWENYNLFGPLLQSASDRRTGKIRTDVRNGNDDEQVEREESLVPVRVKETGYKHLDRPPTALRGRISKMNHCVETGTKSRSSFVGELQLGSDELVGETSNGLRELITAFPLSPGCRVLQDKLSRWWTDRPTRDSYPSVSTVLQRTMPAESVAALERWERRMISKLGEEGFRKYKQDTFDAGSNFHRCIQEHLTGTGVADIEDNVRAHWASLKTVLPHVSDVSLVETKVRHPYLCYTGVIDCVARYRGTTMLIEWKTSQRPKLSLEDTYDNPLQAIAYLGALSFQAGIAVKVDRVALVVAYSSGSPAHVHCLDGQRCQHYWSLWLRRLNAYFELIEQNSHDNK